MRSARKLTGIFVSVCTIHFFLAATNLLAVPAFLVRFSQDPFARPEFRGQCSTCHINPKGGGPRNAFGTAFEHNNHSVTAELRQAWPDRFVPSITSAPVPAGGAEMKATFLSDGQDAILEVDGQRYRLNTRTAKLEKIEADEAAKLVAAPPPPPAATAEPKLPLRDQPTFDHYLVNLPTTLPYGRGVLSMRFTHRFTQAVLGCDNCAGIGELFGLDSFSYSSFGGEIGITRNFGAMVYRSPLNKTIEMGGVYQLLRQRGREPFSASIRVSVEGADNFQGVHCSSVRETCAVDLPEIPNDRVRRHYTRNFEFPISRSISDIAEVFVVPIISIDANPAASFAQPTDPKGISRSNQEAIGLGASIRFRPRTAFVMEWMPRVGGYHERDSHNSYSFGLARTTNGHVFELTLSNTVGTVTSRAVALGSDGLSLGFNIYRRMRGPAF